MRHEAASQRRTRLLPASATTSRSSQAEALYGQHKLSRAAKRHRLSPLAENDGCPASAMAGESINSPSSSNPTSRELAVSVTISIPPCTASPYGMFSALDVG